MSTPLRVAGFLVALVAVFAASLGVGRAVGPLDPAPAEHAAAAAHDGGHETSSTEPAAHLPGGLAIAQDGYALALERSRAEAGERTPLSFTITGPDGTPVTAYDVEHERRLHLIAVRRDASGYQHVHPTLDETTGTWSTRLALAPGDWRLLADFTPSGAEGLTLGADLAVAGAFTPEPPRAVSRTALVDGYRVSVEGELTPGTDSPLTLTVHRGGAPVTDLQPYLGAFGHLVALRDGDLAYLHVHPEESSSAGPEIRFVAEVPSAGSYHLYLDFRHGGRVRTAELTLRAEDAP